MEAAFSGEFLIDEAAIAEKLGRIKMWVFDWDGVFHPGNKNSSGESTYNELDSMGLNLLRFAHFLQNGKVPLFAIVTGAHNPTAEAFAVRENFDAVFMEAKNKELALDYICEHHQLAPEEIAFAFDDVLDINVAKRVGLRFLLSHGGAMPITVDYMRVHNVFDYATAFGGGYGGLREISELCMTLMGNVDEVLEQRIHWSETYGDYWNHRQAKSTSVFKVDTTSVRLLGQV